MKQRKLRFYWKNMEYNIGDRVKVIGGDRPGVGGWIGSFGTIVEYYEDSISGQRWLVRFPQYAGRLHTGELEGKPWRYPDKDVWWLREGEMEMDEAYRVEQLLKEYDSPNGANL